MVDNLQLYNAVRSVPDTAQKPIQGGRLRGMTDINPMWRIRELTNQFGPCGVGWKYEITNKQLQEGANGEIAAFVDINLFVKIDDGWSDAIPGTGGSMFVAKEKSGLYVSDECFKMALTDAISVACKALGFAADVYWDKDRSKYDRRSEEKPSQKPAGTITTPQQKRMFALSGGDAEIVRAVLTSRGYERSEQVTKAEYEAVCKEITELKGFKEGQQ